MRLQSFFSHFTIIAVMFTQCLGSNDINFSAYKTIDTGSPPTFSCNNNVKERIVLRDPCGTIVSPCYPDENHQPAIDFETKIYDLDAYNGTEVVGYQLIFHQFELGSLKTKLYAFPYENGIFSSRNSEYNFYLTGSASSDEGIQQINPFRSQENMFFTTAGMFRLHNSSYILHFVSEEFSDRGYNISYCAEFNKCKVGLICSSPAAGTCGRDIKKTSYFCICNFGYTGAACDDVNECLDFPCDSNANCENTPGYYTCTCNKGYIGNGFSCAISDRCIAENGNNCSRNAHCMNIQAGFNCTCKTGFIGDGVECIDVNECLASPCNSNAHCGNTPGSFACKCNHGYIGDGFSCKISDRCIAENGNNCSLNANCTNIQDGFDCTCKSGFIGDGVVCIADQTKAALKNSTSSTSNMSWTRNDSSIIHDWNDTALLETGENDASSDGNSTGTILGVIGTILFGIISLGLFLFFRKNRKNPEEPTYKASEIAGKNNYNSSYIYGYTSQYNSKIYK